MVLRVFGESWSCRKEKRQQGSLQVDGMAVLVHGIIVAGPIVATSLSVAKFLASERALAVLSDQASEKALSRLCVCGQVMKTDSAVDVREALPQEQTPDMATEAFLDDLSEAQDLVEVAAILTGLDLVAEAMD
jgi:endoribonuclease Dicer